MADKELSIMRREPKKEFPFLELGSLTLMIIAFFLWLYWDEFQAVVTMIGLNAVGEFIRRDIKKSFRTGPPEKATTLIGKLGFDNYVNVASVVCCIGFTVAIIWRVVERFS
jgi:hypothetical protein